MKKTVFLLLPAVLLCFCLGIHRLETRHREQGRQQLEEAVRRAAVSCYASYGFYPPSVAYMAENCGLRYDGESYVIHYERFASNLMPDITVLERSP